MDWTKMLGHSVRNLVTNRTDIVLGIGATTVKLGSRRVALTASAGYCHDYSCGCGALKRTTRNGGKKK
jgi:hypothetical protein